MTEQPRVSLARETARFAGISVPEERLSPLAAGLEVSKYIAAALAAIDYGETEPAPRFYAPGKAP
jgi:hypothetical protein